MRCRKAPTISAANGQSVERASTANIEIVTKEDKSGIDIHIRPGTKERERAYPGGDQRVRPGRRSFTMIFTSARARMW